MKTKAAFLRNVGGPLIIEELEIPKLTGGQVLVQILCSGLCRSQLNEINGRKGKEFIPHLLGHEASGFVVEIGDGVKKVRPQDYVVCSWIKGSGLKSSSAIYYQGKTGKVNAGPVATFASYAVVAENGLVKVPDELPPPVAAILGCAVPTGAGIIDNFKIAGRDKKLAIFGIGGVGAGALLRAVAVGLECYAFDLKPWKLDWAREKLGVKTVNVLFDDVIFSISEFIRFFDFSIECSGSRIAMEMAFECLKDDGTAIIAGNLKPGEKISIDPYELIKGKELKGTWGGECVIDKEIPFYAAEYLEGKMAIDKMISKIYPFDKINEGLKDLEEGKLIRGVVRM